MLFSGPSFLPVDASVSPDGLPGSQLFLIYTGSWKWKQGSKTSESFRWKILGTNGNLLHCVQFAKFKQPNSVRSGLYGLNPEDTLTFFTVQAWLCIYLKTGPYLMIFWGNCYKVVALRSMLGKAQGTPDTSRDSSDVKIVVGRIPNLCFVFSWVIQYSFLESTWFILDSLDRVQSQMVQNKWVCSQICVLKL